MIGKFLAKIFRGERRPRRVRSSGKLTRRFAIEPLESRALLSVTVGLSPLMYTAPVLSSPAVVAAPVTPADSVTTQPTSLLVNLGQTASFSAASSNSGDTVQWQVETGSGSSFTPIAGATSATYTFTPVATDSGNQYEAVFTGNAGTVTSNPATLTVDYVKLQPTSLTLNVGSGNDFVANSAVDSGGSNADTIQWEVSSNAGASFTPIANTNNPFYSFTAAAALDGNEYEAVFTNSAGTLTSNPATLTVDHFTTSPASLAVVAGSTATFTEATSNPSGGDMVQWEVSTNSGTSFTAISGATLPSYSFTATAAAAGDQYEAVITNSLGSFTSSPATLTIATAPSVTLDPTSQLVDVGDTATFAAAATGTPTPTVQWQVSANGGTSFTAISGATSPSYSFTANVGDNGNLYEAVFTNAAGSQSTSIATLTVDSVTAQPANQAVNANGTASFTAATSNSGDTVEWEVSTNSGSSFTPISGATTTTYSFTAAAADSGNQYEAVFTNSAGNVTSSAATLTVDSVTTQPASQTANANDSVTFTAATSNSSDSVQWEVSTNNGSSYTSIFGANSTSYSFTVAAADNGNQYEAVFSNTNGTLTSDAATLTVDSAPSVTTNPSSQSVNAGSAVTLTAAAGGSPAATVQWQVSSSSGSTFTPISGATSASYTFTPTAAENGDEYEAVFTNSSGTATTSPATLTVDSVTTQPASQTANANDSVTFTAATSNSSDTVQWDVSTNNGSSYTSIFGANSTTYSFTAAAADNGDEYEAVFSNANGTLTSNAATLTVDYAPTVSTNPSSQLANAGSAVTLTAAASGSPAATVQWQVSSNSGSTFTPISGATSATYTFTPAAADSGDEYEAVFTNSSGTATTSPATLTVDSATTQPASLTVAAAGTVTFTAATSNSSDTVQWDVSTNNGSSFTAISGATSTTYSFTAATADNGNQYEAVFSNAAGTLTSNAATLTVDSAPSVTTNPTSQSVNAGSTVTLTAAASGSPAATVQWQVMTSGGTSFTAISGAASPTYSFTATAADSGSQYEAVFTNASGTATTSPATLTVDSVTTQPASETVAAAGTATFTAATSNSSDTVQWEVSTASGSSFTPISGATSTTYSLTAAAADSGDEYEAVFSNANGTLTSNAATLTVGAAPSVTTNPTSQTVDAGATVTFTAAASGTPAATVQWEVMTSGSTTFTPISGATSSTYSFTAASADSGNEYEAIFTNSAGTEPTTAATLTVTYVTPDQTTLGPDNSTAAGFTVHNGTVGETYNYSIQSSGGSATVSGSGSLTSATQDITGINVASLPAGTLTYSVTLGSSTQSVTATTPLDVAPAGYTITADLSPISSSEAGSTGFTFAGAATGTTYNYTVSSSGGSGTVTGNGSVTSATQDVTGIDVSSLAAGTLTYSVTLTDSAGNVGAAATASATLESGAGTDMISGYAYLENGTGFPGLTVQAVNTATGAVAAVAQTGSDGSYTFNDLANGTYAVSLANPTPLDVSGAQTDVTLSSTGQSATATNFTGLGVAASQISLRMFLTSSGTAEQFLTAAHSPPTVDANVSGTESYTTGDNALTIASGATITAPDSATLASMTVSIGNLSDGASELLTAAITSPLSSNYDKTSGELTISGVADIAAYQAVLQSVAYSDSAATVTAGKRTISITAYDGTDNSSPVAVTVNVVQGPTSQPLVTTSPSSQTVNAGSSVTFSAAGSGEPTPTVQWEVSSNSGSTFTDISGATSDSYTFTATAADSGNEYEAVFSNGIGTPATTSAATLTVDSVTTQPSSQTVDSGATATFTAAASGTPTVQWEVKTSSGTTFSPISGATSTTYSLTAAASDNGNEYEAVLTNSAGTLTSDAATLTVDYQPAVTTNPASELINLGGTATFTAAATGNPAATVQWEVSGNQGSSFSTISGATSATYSFTPTAADSGNEYEAVFSNSVGSATSTAATLTVDSFTAQPDGATAPTGTVQTVNEGAAVTLTAATSHTGDTVQWEVSSGGGAFTAISGATSPSYSFTATSGDNGNVYEAVFTNSAGKLTSDAVTLTVDFAPSVTTNPASELVNLGGTATFTAAATGSPTPTVQWAVKTSSGTTFTPISGATSATYSFTPTTADSGNQYEADFTNSVGATDTTAATLTVDSITTQPSSQTVNDGAAVTLTAATSNSGDTVQWQLSSNSGSTFTAISGATSPSYSFTAASGDNGNEYRAVFTNSAGTLTTTAATLTVDFAPSVTTDPSSALVNLGGTATFTAVASGEPAPTVQWQVKTSSGTTFTPITGATSATYSFTPTAADSGSQYEAVFTNAVGVIDTTAATLTVDSVTSSPASETVNTGASVTLTAASSHSGDTVQWMVKTGSGTTFTDVSGATSTTYSFTAAGSNNGSQYEAVFSNSAGSLTTSAATVSVDYVTSQPTSQNVLVGGTATFTAASSDPSGNDTVQWMVSSNSGSTFTPISGATSTSYSLAVTSAENGNQYEAVFTNSLGSFDSNAATLTAEVAPSVTQNPASQSLNAGQTATFSAVATGTPTPTVQWMVKTGSGTTFTAISGATSATYSLTAAAGDNGSQYEAVFTNEAGSQTTTAATLTVDSVTLNPQSQAITAGGTVTFTAASADPSGHDTVQWEVSTNNGSTFTAISGATSTSYSFTVASADSGNEYEAVFTNSNGSLTSSAATLTVGVAPTVTLSPQSQTVNAGSSVTLTATATGSPQPTVQWEVKDNGSQTFTPIGNATSTSYTFTAADSYNGSEYEAVFTNSAGSVTSSPATLTVVYVTPDQTTLGPDNNTAAGFTINGGTANESFSYTAKSSGGSGTVTGNGTLSGPSYDVQNINVSSLPAGTLTYTVTLGNSSQPLTAATSLDIAPSGYAVTPSANSYNLVTGQTASFSVNNTAVGDTLTYLVAGNSSGYVANTIPVTADPQIVTVNISSFSAGSTLFEAKLTDAGGNTGAEEIAYATLNTTQLSGYSLAAVPSVINAADSATAAVVLDGPAPATGTTYIYSVSSSGSSGGTAPMTGSGTVSSASQTIPIDVASLPDGTLTYSVGVMDSTGAVIVQTTAQLDQTAPSGFTVTPDQGTINDVAVNSTGFTIAGAAANDQYSYTVSGISGHVTGTLSAATQDITNIDLASLPNGNVTYSVTLTNPAGDTSSAVTGSATIDRTAPEAIALSTSVAPTGQPALGTLVAVIQTTGAESTATQYTYSLSGADAGSFKIDGDELQSGANFDSAEAGGQTTFNITIQSSDGVSTFQQAFTITAGTDPVTPTMSISPSNPTVTASQTATGPVTVGTVSTAANADGNLGTEVTYSLVNDGVVANDNDLFTINPQTGVIETNGTLQAGKSYSVTVRSSSTYLISDVDNLTGVTAPYAFEMSYDPTQFPTAAFQSAAINAGLVTLMVNNGSGWVPAVTANKATPGSQAQVNYQGSYASFTASNPALTSIIGSSGLDTGNDAAWAVVDQSGEYAVGVQVFTEQTFTITAS